MSDGMKLLLGGVGAYFLYNWYMANYGQAAPSGANQSGGSGAAAGGSQSVTQQSANAPVDQPPVVTADKLIAAAGGNTNRTADAWNYVYSLVSGVHQTANLYDPSNRGEMISVTTYLARRHAAGLSGIGAIFGVPAYAFADGRGPRGAQSMGLDVRGMAHATGWERARKVRMN